MRYTTGTMPTAKGFTGQYADASTGLDYYGARYYDPMLGQFTSADTVDEGFNRYAYVHGNPETDVDPTGHVGVGDAWETLIELVWSNKKAISDTLIFLGVAISTLIPFTPRPPTNFPSGSSISGGTNRTTGVELTRSDGHL